MWRGHERFGNETHDYGPEKVPVIQLQMIRHECVEVQRSENWCLILRTLRQFHSEVKYVNDFRCFSPLTFYHLLYRDFTACQCFRKSMKVFHVRTEKGFVSIIWCQLLVVCSVCVLKKILWSGVLSLYCTGQQKLFPTHFLICRLKNMWGRYPDLEIYCKILSKATVRHTQMQASDFRLWRQNLSFDKPIFVQDVTHTEISSLVCSSCEVLLCCWFARGRSLTLLMSKEQFWHFICWGQAEGRTEQERDVGPSKVQEKPLENFTGLCWSLLAYWVNYSQRIFNFMYV